MVFAGQDELGAKALLIHKQLNNHFYPPFIHQNDRLGPLSQLIYALLSQRTRDEVTDRAFRKLCGSYWTWAEVRDAPFWRIEMLIAEVTWPDVKAEYILESLKTISDWSGWSNPNLDFLSDLPDAEAAAWLEKLKGVGPKTSAVVLLFSTLRRAMMPVDTHFYRSAGRIGLIRQNTSDADAHAILRAQLPPEWKAADLERHYFLMKGLGQRFCTARYPRCRPCPARDLCNHAQMRQSSGAKALPLGSLTAASVRR